VTFTKTNIPVSITTGYQDPISDLFIPLLENASTYDIAVGYFTSGWLRDTAEGMAQFAHAGGRSRWVISPSLNKLDAQSIRDGAELYNEYDFNEIERSIAEHITALKSDAREELCALIGSGVLQFRIAIPKKNQGMLHAKIGIATDALGEVLGFTGSYNLTAAAKSNWENIEVFRSWIPSEKERIDNLEARFESLWINSDPTYEVVSPSEELMRHITSLAGEELARFSIQDDDLKNSETTISLRPYQETAIDNWRNNRCRGTLVMATGSGKTITAISAIKELQFFLSSEKNSSLFIVIVVPLKHLLDQWHEELSKFDLPALKCYESSASWRPTLSEKVGLLSVIKGEFQIALVTNRTFSTPHFQSIIKKTNIPFLLVADEAHNLGSETYIDALPDNASFRLALSATPERYNDKAGTRALFNYFGDPVFEFTIDEAIEAKYLCCYKYYPHICEMSGQEYEEYSELAHLISIEAQKTDSSGQKTKEHVRLLGKRADLITGVHSKLKILAEQLEKQQVRGDLSHTLIYCGSKKGENSERHIERTQRIIGTQIGIKARKFTADEPLDERRQILSLFQSGELQAITAIKCLDEGIDIPATRTAYILASTANPKEFIQRRGRVLRNYHGKTVANIHDFLVIPPTGSVVLDDLVDREISRANEFARLATNKQECQQILEDIERPY